MLGDLFPYEVSPGAIRDAARDRGSSGEAKALDANRIERDGIHRKARDYIGRNPHQQADMPIPLDALLGEFPLTSQIPGVVLDTNVVLDWLLFGDPSVAPLAAAIERRHVRWLATPSMREELSHVLVRGLAAARSVDPAAVLSGWDAHTASLPQASPQALRCSDADDQKFVDLALGVGARWLVSRDRAVLRLSRRAAPLGTLIVTPQRWQPQ